MAAGDFYTRRNGAEVTVLPNTGTNLDLTWDTLVQDEGGIVTYSDPNIQLDIGIYLIMYSEAFNTTNTTTNERITAVSELFAGGVSVGGFGGDYIRKSSGDQEMILSSQFILEVTADNTDVFVRVHRVDNSTTGTVLRMPGYGGISVLQLDNTHNYGLYSTSATEATSATTVRTLNINTNDRQDTGFSRSGAVVTCSTAGRYLITYGMEVSQAATGRETAFAFLTKNGTTTVVPGSQGYMYVRGLDVSQAGAIHWSGIVDLAANDTLQLRWYAPVSVTFTATAGAYVQLWQLPASADTCIMEATTGDYNANADFAWDTLPHIDTASYTASAGATNIDVDLNDYTLAFATCSQLVDSTTQRAVPLFRFALDDVLVDYACGCKYHRNSSTATFAVNVAGLLSTPIGTSIELHTVPWATTGALANISGQFSTLSLTSVFGTYPLPPTVSDVTSTTVTGNLFESLKGTGKLELIDGMDYAAANKIEQTTSAWSDGSITYTFNKGTFADGPAYLIITTDSGLRSSATTASSIYIGLKAYSDVVSDLDPDHHWTMDDTALDIAARGGAKPLGSVGTPIYNATSITRGSTHSLYFSTNVGVEVADSIYTNITDTHEVRYMGGWMMVDAYQEIPKAIYEEGGGVNNFYFCLGFGNTLMINAADDNDFGLQAFSNSALVPNRAYHVMFKFEGTNHDGEFRLFVDGVLQDSFAWDLPLVRVDMSTHSGDAVFGKPDGSLNTGGTDVTYASANNLWLSQWSTYSALGGGAPLTVAEIREELFEKGTLADEEVLAGTESVMQSSIDAFSDTVRPNHACALRIASATSGANVSLTFDNITFDPLCSIQVQYMGEVGEELTIVMINGTVLEAVKISTPNGGTVVLVNAPKVRVTSRKASDSSILAGARVLLKAAAGGSLATGTSLVEGVTNAEGYIEINFPYSSDQPVTGRVRRATNSPYYKTALLTGTINSTGLNITAFMLLDE